MLASQGFVTLALAFFGVDDLPGVYSSFEMEYFEEAVDYLLGLNQVSTQQVGLCGISTGANISLLMRMFFGHKIKASAVFGSVFVSAPGPALYKEEMLEGSDFAIDENNVPIIKGGIAEIKRCVIKKLLISL